MTSRKLARRSLTLLASTLILSACSPGGFNVGVERLVSTIIFGAFKPQAPPSPQPLAPLAAPQLPNLPGFEIPAGGPADLPCPAAAPGTPAQKRADSNVSGPATNGVYKWFSTYTRTAGSASTTTSGFEDREVRQAQYLGQEVTSTGGQPDYTYQWIDVKPDPFEPGYLDELTFQAHTYSNLDNPPSSSTVGDFTQIQYGGNYDPYGGIDLIDLKRYKPGSTSPAEEFQPNSTGAITIQGQQFSGPPGLLIFTLPVPEASSGPPVVGPTVDGLAPGTVPAGGEFQWQESASDATHQWTEAINATMVNQRVAVDACGSIVDGWPVKATLTITKNDPATGQPYTSPLTLTWNYVVAPQYGGLIVQENIEGDGGYGSTVKTAEVWGSLDIAPLPKVKGS